MTRLTLAGLAGMGLVVCRVVAPSTPSSVIVPVIVPVIVSVIVVLVEAVVAW